jgi:hypothetical protein
VSKGHLQERKEGGGDNIHWLCCSMYNYDERGATKLLRNTYTDNGRLRSE